MIWRIVSNEASLELTNMYDIRARLGSESFLPQGALLDIAEGCGRRGSRSRNASYPSTQVEVATADGPLFVTGRILGVDMTDGEPGRERGRGAGRSGHRGDGAR